MFMEKIDLPRVTCDLFSATKGFEGSGCGSDKPRAANEDEARAYADFIRRKCGLPDLGKVQMERRPYPNGRGDFYYVGATFGQVLSGGGWEGEPGNREYVPAQYEPGAFSVLFPGANQMRATVTLETLDDAGEVVASQTMPVEPKKGGVVWSKDDVRKACGPVAKAKAARAPTVAKRRAAPTMDKRRRAVLLALKLRAELRRERAISTSRFGHIMDLTRDLHGVGGAESREDCAAPRSAPDAPATAPDVILSDLAAAEALMRGEGYVAPAPVYAAPERVRIRSTIIGNLQYGRLQDEAFVVGQAGGFEAMTGSDAAAWHWQREGRSTAYGEGFATREDALAALDSFLAEQDTPTPTVDEPEATPTAIQRPKRTPAHERAIRRAWAERKARRVAAVHLRIGTAQYEHVKGELERVKALEACTRSLASEMSEESAKRMRAVEDRARLAEQEAAEALAAREDMQRLLRDAEARLAAAEAENAQLWAEIEGLTAPAPALAA